MESQVIAKPMDLGTVKRKLTSGDYTTVEELRFDVHLVFDNAVKFNKKVLFLRVLLLMLRHPRMVVAVSYMNCRCSNDNQCPSTGRAKLKPKPTIGCYLLYSVRSTGELGE